MAFSLVHIILCFIAGLVTGWIVRAKLQQTTIQPISAPPDEPSISSDHSREEPELLDDDETRIQMRPIAIGAKPDPTPVPEMDVYSEVDVYIDEISEEFTEDLELPDVLSISPHTDVEEITSDIDIGVEDVLSNDDTMPFRRPEWDNSRK